MTVARLQSFSDAWDRGDLDTLMTFFTEDCEFSPSVESAPGQLFCGKAAVAAEFKQIFQRDGGFKSRSGVHAVLGTIGYCEWFLIVDQSPRLKQISGCDVFEFEGDLIRRKNAFRKTPLWL